MVNRTSQSSTAWRTISRRQALSVFLAAQPLLSAARAAGPPTSGKLRLALSESLFTSVNPNDARAAMKVWLRKVSAEMNLPVELDTDVFMPSGQLVERVRQGQVDAVGISTLEYRVISEYLDGSELVSAADNLLGRYGLFVKRDSGIQKLADLHGRSIVLHHSAFMTLASPWLSTVLFDERLEQPEDFFGSFTREPHGTKTVLPVFFGKTDACVVSHRVFRTMSELNPQVAKQLIPLANSQDLLPNFHIFVKGYRANGRAAFMKALAGVKSTEAGRQLMTLFQFDGLAVTGGEKLLASVSMIEKAERARGMKPGANKWA